MVRGKKMSGQENRRHPEAPAYRCFLSDLTGFARLRRAGPTRTVVRILDVREAVNRSVWICSVWIARIPSINTEVQNPLQSGG